jgi:hypothetical protein
MLVRYKYGAHFVDVQPHLIHPYLRFAAREARIYQQGILPVADVVAVAIAARIDGCCVQCHKEAAK